jgi:hypothetical protein
MITDKQLYLADAAAPTSTGTTYPNVYDLGVARDVGKGESLWVVAIVRTTFTSGGSATLASNLVDDDNATPSSPATLMELFPATAVASLVAGTVLAKKRLPSNTQRYLSASLVVATADMTAGAIFITNDVDAQQYYPNAILAF